MKKLLSAFLLSLLLVMTVGCGNKSNDWLSQQGIKITNKNFVKSFTTATYNQNMKDDSKSYTDGEVDIPIKVTIKESKKTAILAVRK